MAFTLTGPSQIEVKQGESVSAVYRATRTTKPYRQVTFSITGLPSGVSGAFSPLSGTPTFQSTLTLRASSTSAIGTFTVTVTARDAKSSKSMPVVFSNYSPNLPPAPPAAPETADYYIATAAGGGSDANNGTTPQTPWLTFEKADTVVTAGKKVLVEDGTYLSGTSFSCNTSGTSGNRIWYKSRNYLGAKLQGAASTDASVIGIYLPASWVKFEGFDIFDWRTTGAGDVSATAFYVEGTNNVIRHNKIRNIGNVCINAQFGQTGIFSPATFGGSTTVEGNIFHDIGRWRNGEQGCGFLVNSLDQAIYCDGNDGWLIRNNVFYANDYGWDIHLYPSAQTNLKIINNTFADANPDKPGAIIVASNVTTAEISNNIFYQKTTSGINWFSGTMSGVTVRNNISTNLVHDTGPPAGVTSSGNIIDSTTINFVNAGTRDYHLQTSSAAKDTGLTLSDVTEDFDGLSRPQGAAYCRGAFEFV